MHSAEPRAPAPQLGPWLFTGLIAIVSTSFIGIFFPFGQTTDLIIAIGSALIFSGYIIYDTHAVMKRLSPDEYVMGALRLYLDLLNLFIAILRIVSHNRSCWLCGCADLSPAAQQLQPRLSPKASLVISIKLSPLFSSRFHIVPFFTLSIQCDTLVVRAAADVRSTVSSTPHCFYQL
jgi:hypothetical protein